MPLEVHLWVLLVLHPSSFLCFFGTGPTPPSLPAHMTYVGWSLLPLQEWAWNSGLTNHSQCNWFSDRHVPQTGSIRISPRILVGNGERQKFFFHWSCQVDMMPVWGFWGHLCPYLGRDCLRMKLIQKTSKESMSIDSWCHCLSTWIQPCLKLHVIHTSQSA